MEPDSTLLQELVRRITQTVSPKRIILFGSAGRGEMRHDSDLDVLVVVPEDVDRAHTIKAIYKNLIGFALSTDVILATETDLRLYGENRSLVYYPALREGREIYAA